MRKRGFLAIFTVADASYEKLTSNKEKVDYIRRRLRIRLPIADTQSK
jgi:hypothetical protein